MDDQALHTEKELFRRIAVGDEQAFTACVHHFTPFLYPYLKQIVQSESWAEDLLQDIYVRLWKNRSQLAGIENPGGYINRMASNLALDFLKHRAVEVKAQYRIERQLAASVTSGGEENYDGRLYAELLREAMEQLTPQQRRAFQLRHEEHLSYEEIAEALSISRNTVRNHLVASMNTIRSYLKDHTDIFLVVAFLVKNILK